MKRILIVAITLLVVVSCTRYKYEQVEGDPLKTRIYTLDNGLKVYLSVNKDQPRIQTYIAVKVGSKNDPAETTGLAHYFEHLMFKGTSKFGTSDCEAEKPLLDNIEELFETYRKTTDEAERKAIYKQIDNVSQEAAKYAIPNEYDKLMSKIGAQGTNAFTSNDVTAYVENIPSNELENWAYIQSERFKDPVLRLFHTELETVYEEYNMSLTNDSWKVQNTVYAALFPTHPYGTQTVIGTPEHLKNPSITNIKKYFETYYVPNNMAVCIAGDINPNETIKIIDKYFGSLAKKEIPELKIPEQKPVTSPIIKEVVGLEAENITIAYRFPGANSTDAVILQFVDYLLTNGQAGLIDLNLVQKQKTLSAESYTIDLEDYSMLVMNGTPKEDQSLDEVRTLLLEQLDLLKKGEFEEALLEAVINNFKLGKYYQQQSPGYATQMFLQSFIYNIEWNDMVNRIDIQSKLTKQDIVDFCNKYFNDNYVVVYKREGKLEGNKIDKPEITPIPTNRNEESAFLASIETTTPLEPVFVDYDKDFSRFKIKSDIEVLYKQNTTNPLFEMDYVFEMGNNHDKLLGHVFNYMNYLGTSQYSAEEIKSELYKLACSFDVSSTDERVYVSISGLGENFEPAMLLLENRLADAVADIAAWKNMVADIAKSRNDAKLDQSSNFSVLLNYAIYGAKSPTTNILSLQELNELNPQVLANKIKNLKNYNHKVLYYGPLSEDDLKDALNKNHAVANKLEPIPEPVKFVEQETDKNKVFLAQYDAPQIYFAMLSKGITGYDKSIEPVRRMYNNYFGVGMNAIVFQEMREARALAYSAGASYSSPEKPEKSYYLSTFIATQNDKLKEATEAFIDILNNMPEAENSFNIAKEGALTSIRTSRTLRSSVSWSYLRAQEFNDYDLMKNVYEATRKMTLQDIKAFQEKYVKNKPYTYCILGDIADLDIEFLNSLGEVQILSQKEIFGY